MIRSTISVLACVALLASCATTIPETDDRSPQVMLQISGDDLVDELGQEVDELTLKNLPDGRGEGRTIGLDADSVYSFVLTVRDRGGVRNALLRMPDGMRLLGDVLPVEVQQDQEVDGFEKSQLLSLRGDRENPSAELEFSGRFAIDRDFFGLPDQLEGEVVDLAQTSIEAIGGDYGGQQGGANFTLLHVNLLISPEKEEIEDLGDIEEVYGLDE